MAFFLFPMKEGERPLDIFKLFGKIIIEDEEAHGKLGKIGETASNLAGKFGNMIKVVGTATVAAAGACASAVGAITKQAIESYAEYEQLVGGAELMFGDAYDYIADKAKNAYSTVQMSQNEYLQQVNGFAVGLKTALGGNEQAAAELASRIITAEADIVAATGNSQEAVQNAFNGIMKNNFSMLDNLGLGITATKEGMQEVIDKTNAWNAENGRATAYQIDNIADCQSALLDYIEMQEMSGYAAAEAAGTIQGSLSMAKAAWSNLVTGIADENANMTELIDNFVETIVGDGSGQGGVISNIIPRIKQSLEGVGHLVDRMIPIIIEKVPTIVTEWLPELLQSGVSMVQSILDGMLQNSDSITSGAVSTILTFTTGILESLPDILVSGTLLIGELAAGLIQALPDVIAKIPEIIVGIADAFSENADVFLEIGKSIVTGIWNGIVALWGSLEKNMSWLTQGLTAAGNAMATGGSGALTPNMFNGSHADGLDYVPFDGYIAELHKGEMVVPAEEAKMLRSGASCGGANSEVANILTLILDAIQEGNSQEKVFKVNNREFGRMIRGAVNA